MEKYYGDITKDSDVDFEKINADNTLELFSKQDILSNRTLNRPLAQLEKEIRKIDTKLNAICKTFTNGEGIIPGYFENMNISNVTIGKLNINGKRYLRIPTGIFSYKFKGSYDTYYNLPKIEIFERQLAEHFNLDLHDQDSDLQLKYFVEDGKLKYYLEITNTAYNYNTTDNSTSVSTYIEKNRLPIIETEYYNNVFEIVEGMYNKYSSYLTKRDDLFSLEEIIEFSTDWEGQSDFIVFFNPYDNYYEDLLNYSTILNYENLSSDFDHAITELGNDFTEEELNNYVKTNGEKQDDYGDLEVYFYKQKYYIYKNEKLYVVNHNYLYLYDNISWSYSKKFGLVKEEDYNMLDHSSFIKLYKFNFLVNIERNKILNIETSLDKQDFLQPMSMDNLLILNDKTKFKGVVNAKLETDNTAVDKTDAVTSVLNAVDSIKQLGFVDFNGGKNIGFNSEEAPDIFSNSDKTSLDYYNTINVLLKAIQELNARIETLEQG